MSGGVLLRMFSRLEKMELSFIITGPPGRFRPATQEHHFEVFGEAALRTYLQLGEVEPFFTTTAPAGRRNQLV